MGIEFIKGRNDHPLPKVKMWNKLNPETRPLSINLRMRDRYVSTISTRSTMSLHSTSYSLSIAIDSDHLVVARTRSHSLLMTISKSFRMMIWLWFTVMYDIHGRIGMDHGYCDGSWITEWIMENAMGMDHNSMQ
jgi:hypothetical protein